MNIAEKLEEILLYDQCQDESVNFEGEYWKQQDLKYDLAKDIVRKNRFKFDGNQIDTTEYFENVEETVSDEYGYLITTFVFKSKATGKFFAVYASTDSWEDDGCFGEDFNVAQVFPKKITITKYVTADKLKDSWS